LQGKSARIKLETKEKIKLRFFKRNSTCDTSYFLLRKTERATRAMAKPAPIRPRVRGLQQEDSLSQHLLFFESHLASLSHFFLSQQSPLLVLEEEEEEEDEEEEEEEEEQQVLEEAEVERSSAKALVSSLKGRKYSK
jgi:hypothetical protein